MTAPKLPQPKYTVTNNTNKYTILLPSGESIGPLKRVTGVLNVIEKPALKGWAARMSADYFKKEILRIGARALDVAALEAIAADAARAHTKFAKDAADLGVTCHDAFEAIILGKEPSSLPPELVEPVAAFKTWRLQSDIEIVVTEIAVASAEHRYGGRIDALGYSPSRGGWGIVDFKTSSGFYGNEYAYQVGGGYAIAVKEMFSIDVAWGEIVRFSKKPPYESESRPVTDMDASARAFLQALALTRSNEIKLIGAPTFTSAGIPMPVANGTKAKSKKALPTAMPF